MRDATGGVQSVLVLGGGSEIARATVERLAEGRCRRVVLAGRAGASMDASVAALSGLPVEVETVELDAADTGSHESVIADVFAGGDIDVVLLAFGVLGDQAAIEADHAAAREVVQVNYAGAVSTGLAVADHLRTQGHGTLVVLSSVAGVRGRRDNYVYGSTKAGLDTFASGLGDALHGTGARVMVVRPGFVATKMTEGREPAPFSTTAEAVAGDIVDGLRRGRHTVWSPAVLQYVFGALRFLPRPLWRRLATR